MKVICSFLLVLTLSLYTGITIAQSDKKIKTSKVNIILSPEQLKDKIKGGWAGQTIGVTFGGPYEFQFNGTFIQDYQPLLWNKTVIKKNMIENPGLYDDLYMDLTFVDVFERYGLDAPMDSFANAFANAGYLLWHAELLLKIQEVKTLPWPKKSIYKSNPLTV